MPRMTEEELTRAEVAARRRIRFNWASAVILVLGNLGTAALTACTNEKPEWALLNIGAAVVVGVTYAWTIRKNRSTLALLARVREKGSMRVEISGE